MAAAIAAVAGVGAWYYAHRAVADSAHAFLYERLREARSLVGTIRVTADNTLFGEAREAAAQLRAVLATLPGDFPATRKLAETEWNRTSYEEADLQGTVAAARAELERAVAALSSS